MAKIPGDYFIASQTVNSVNISPCIYFRVYGGKKYAVSLSNLYFEGLLGGGNYGICGIDLRNRTSAAPTGWKTSMAYTANTTLNKKHVVVLDYLKAGTGSGSIVFYSSWSNPDDIPEGTSALSQSLSSTSRAVTRYLYNGSVSHIRISGEPNSQVTAYSAVYAVGKYVNPRPCTFNLGQ